MKTFIIVMLFFTQITLASETRKSPVSFKDLGKVEEKDIEKIQPKENVENKKNNVKVELICTTEGGVKLKSIDPGYDDCVESKAHFLKEGSQHNKKINLEFGK